MSTMPERVWVQIMASGRPGQVTDREPLFGGNGWHRVVDARVAEARLAEVEAQLKAERERAERWRRIADGLYIYARSGESFLRGTEGYVDLIDAENRATPTNEGGET